MTGIGHNKPPHQLETIELEGIPVTLYKRGDTANTANWQMRIKVPGSSKYVRSSTKCDDLAKAKEVAMERYIEIKVQLKNDIPIFSKTFGDLAKEFLRNANVRLGRKEITKETVTVQTQRINRFFIPYFGKKAIDSINQATVDAFWGWRIDYWKNNGKENKGRLPTKDHTPASTTLQAEGTLLNSIFNSAIRQGLMQQHLKPDHKPPVKIVTNRRSELTRNEYIKLSRYMRPWVMSDLRPYVLYSRARLRYLIKIAVNSGMRPPEFYNLTWNDYSKHSDDEMEWTELRVHGKGKKHTIMCSIRVFNDLESWKDDSFYTKPDDYVFAGWDGKRAGNLNKPFKNLLVEAGIPLKLQGDPRTLYSLRHTYATFRLRSGVDVYDLSENMDTSIDMIKKHYGHVKGADRAKAVIFGRKRFLSPLEFC